MDARHHNNTDQTTLWNEVAGRAWVDAEALVDHVYRPFEHLLVEAVPPSAARILDVGCGTGATTLAAARKIGAQGLAVGIDVSEPMIAAARARAERHGVSARFIRADAQRHAFEPASFDAIISRFGVMFFDGAVSAFRNLRRAAAEHAALTIVVWRSADENPFMTTAERAVAPLVPNLPPRQADAPGQFAFADRERVRRILDESGWTGIEIRPIDVTCTFPETELVEYFTRFGPLGRVYHELDEETRRRAIDAVRPAFDPFVHGADVRFTAACWTISAG